MKYAVFASGGKQYKVSEGDIVELEKLPVEAGKEVVFDKVLLFVEDDTVKLGQPEITGLTIGAKVLDQIKADKIRVAKFKAKSRYRKVYGHRQHLTKVQIMSIGTSSKKVEKNPDSKKTTKK